MKYWIDLAALLVLCLVMYGLIWALFNAIPSPLEAMLP